MDFILGFVEQNFILLALLILVFLVLVMRPVVSSTDFKPLYFTLICIFAFKILDYAEGIASNDSSYYILRLILSVVCYWLRPLFCVGFLLIVAKNKKHRLVILILELINVVIMGLAFIPGIGKLVFYFDETYAFTRGPLGITVFVISFMYLFIILFSTIRYARIYRTKESSILLVCAIVVALSTILEAIGFISNVSSPLIVLSCLVYYLYIYVQLTSKDELTGLLNRESFYSDAKSKMKSITGVATIDMNGLKTLNDTKGHDAGDLGLKTISSVIKRHTDYNSRGYRVGGDEFLLLFTNKQENDVLSVCKIIKEEVEKEGFSVSIGYTTSKKKSIDAMIKESDTMMYNDKAEYYKTHERRKNY